MLTVVCLRRDGRMQVPSPSSPSLLELCLKAPYAIAFVLYPCTVPDIPSLRRLLSTSHSATAQSQTCHHGIHL